MHDRNLLGPAKPDSKRGMYNEESVAKLSHDHVDNTYCNSVSDTLEKLLHHF